MGQIVDLLHSPGTTSSLQHLFIRFNIRLFPSTPISFSISATIPSSPAAFPLFIPLNANIISSSVIDHSSSPLGPIKSGSRSLSSAKPSTLYKSSKNLLHLSSISLWFTIRTPFSSFIAPVSYTHLRAHETPEHL